MTSTDRLRDDVHYLNVFLCRERSAYETYRVCVDAISNPEVRGALTRLRASNQGRVRALDTRIRALGGTPLPHSSVSNALARLVAHGAEGPLEQVAVVTALEHCSGQSLRVYRASLHHLSPETRRFIVRYILPDRQRAHEAVKSLRRAV